MPVSVVCETTANVNAALREELFGSAGSGSSCSAAANAKVVATDDGKTNGSSASGLDDSESLHGKLVASAKRVLLSKIEYEEVSNYGQSVLETLKSKYIVLKPTSGLNNSQGNGRSSPATCNNNNNNNGANGDSSSSTADANGNATTTNTSGSATTNGGTATTPGKKIQQNPNELPAPKRILYPRENVRIGWKATGRKWDVGVGMMNVGNTCYLNSTLQALFHVPSMANWLMSDSAHMERCESTDSGCIICAMAKTLQASQNSQSAIRPYFVYSKLKSICKHLVMGRQEDAHEFLRYLVEAMEKSYLSRFRNYKELDQYSKETTPLNQILGGYLKTSVKCLSCQHVSVTFQHFQDLLLDIRKADTIDEALEGYFARERLEDMGYKCEACKKKVSATKQFSLDRAPIALCIQLKRFSMLGTKINKQITIKPRLDLTKFASRKIPGEQLTYRLVAMVTHLGASQHCGHYTAIGLTESGTYYNYDDSYVRPISIQNVCNTNAYIIFYEMDTQPPRQVTSTQVSGAQSTVSNPKELQPPKVNGHVLSASQPQRIIGPQLPPGFSSGNAPASPLANGGSKLMLNRNAVSSSPASNNSKIMIHFKNSNSNNSVKTSLATNSVATSSATSTNSVFDSLKGSNNNNYNCNGLHMAGSGKFQEFASTKYSLGGPTNKRQVNNAKNGNESSSDDDDENEIVSSSTSIHSSNGKATLPSMPRLGGVEMNSSNTSAPKSLTNGFMKKSPAPIKSLVPYGSETEEEEPDMPTTTNIISLPSTCDQQQQKRLLSNPLKRRQSSSSCSNGSSSDNDVDGKDNASTTGAKIKKAVSSTIVTTATATTSTDSKPTHYNGVASSKKSSDTTIDEIFNCNKRSNNNNFTANTNGVTTPKKKSQNQQFTVTSTTPTTDSSTPSSASNSDAEETKSSKPQFKRSHSTPPSPPVVKTNSGIWQVTSLHPISACVSPTSEKLPKNPKNPFASRPTALADCAKRLKKELPNKHFNGNGYQRESAASDSAVSELLKQSHRGYGAPVLTWNGQQSEIERENYDLFDEKRIEDDNNHNIDNNNSNNIIMGDSVIDNDQDEEYSKTHCTNSNQSCDANIEQHCPLKKEHDVEDGDDNDDEDNDNDNDDDNDDDIIDLISTTNNVTTSTNFLNDNVGSCYNEHNDYDDIIKTADDEGFGDKYSPQHTMEVDENPEANNIDKIYCTTSPKASLDQRQRRHHLHIDLKINNNCLPLLENCTKMETDKEEEEEDGTGETTTTENAADESSTTRTSCSSTANSNSTTSTTTPTATDEQINVDSSCSSATTATTVINTYCLSPNSTDNEPTTPTLATTINDIIFQFSEDSLDHL
ncbi:ubiquitin carboxyl-terminal hydrolase 36 isoform X2 [Stomoxys calcitrans]|uniref:ubiquitin carboxyl-terminal hydrolase 36 isoform X2 n=1 Tax=Stomoxys calcitrans TaxID=35570 RepID=UPI0027E2F2BC|nr:ubiquitin carboxyl-terminal hydrolase 36 isoform X2 [Stomoxys calcitrans]